MLVFIKLGGSLITDKSRPKTPRLDVLQRLAQEVASARSLAPELKILLGHGSGSFGHVEAERHGTVRGVKTPADWFGFAEVWQVADLLSRMAVDAFSREGIPVVRFSPSAGGMAESGRVAEMLSEPIRAALDAGLVPVVYGDVMFDRERGGTIASTEDVFVFLAQQLRPDRILLAGIESGVYADFPRRTQILARLTPATWEEHRHGVGGSSEADVTGGMAGKVELMLELVRKLPALEVLIFSGQEPRAVTSALLGKPVPGTWISL
ncbi:MAG: isopentenyl phosphate kinase [Anaerolineales bacterium]|jgi:isopentenyl phosphate kinase